eukprot:874760-Prymnesium_polylepis.1
MAGEQQGAGASVGDATAGRAGKAFLSEEGKIYVQTKGRETTLTVRDCDSEGNQKGFSPIQEALSIEKQKNIPGKEVRDASVL